MLDRLPETLILSLLAALAGCETTAVDENPLPPVIVPDEPLVTIPEEPTPEELAPGACEVLLSRLNETHPLLGSLDESLESQAERIEQAVARLTAPPAEPVVRDCPETSSDALGQKEIIGELEWLYMDPPGLHYRARIDSGAETSSLSALNVTEFERDGDDWVRFSFQHDSEDDVVEFELPIKRTVLVRVPSFDDPDRRVVVEIDVRLGDQLQTTEFTLTDRNNMTYPVIIGRAFLRDLYVIDISRTYIHEKYDPS